MLHGFLRYFEVQQKSRNKHVCTISVGLTCLTCANEASEILISTIQKLAEIVSLPERWRV